MRPPTRAARAGLREGDVILAIGNIEVANVKEFESAQSQGSTRPSRSTCCSAAANGRSTR